MAKSVFYSVSIPDESKVLGVTFKVMSRPELISFLRSGQVFTDIEPFNFESLSERFFGTHSNKPNGFNPKPQEFDNEHCH